MTTQKRPANLFLLGSGILLIFGLFFFSSSSVASGAEGGEVIRYDHKEPLGNASFLEVSGEALLDGGCSFPIPELSLGPDESAVEARPVWANYDNCTMELEIGTPSRLDWVSDDGAHHVEPFTERAHRSGGEGSTDSASALLASAVAYYEVRWHDPVEITTSRTRAYTDWTWNGPCVTGSSNWVRGNFDGSVSGGITNGTWTTETGGIPSTCPNLHYHVVLVKTP